MARYPLFLRTLALLALLPTGTTRAATKVFFNGHIHPLDRKSSAAEWLAVEDGRVVGFGVGDHHRALPAAERVDLRGQHLLPSLTDAHAHLLDLGRESDEVDLRGARHAEAAAARVARHAARHPGDEAIVGNGWDQTDWPGGKFPTREPLDRAAGERPVILYRIDGHAAWVNTAALKRSGLWEAKTDPAGGRVVRAGDGRPTGILVDAAMAPASALATEPSDATIERAVETAVQRALSVGITSVHDAGVTLRQIEAKRRLLRSGRVRFRFYDMVSARDEAMLDEALRRGPEIGAENGQLTVRTVKLFADGAMGSRGALFREPYSDEATTRGLWVTPYEELRRRMKKIDARGFQIAVHAIGSLANARMIDAFEEVLGPSAIARKRPRLEHAQVLEAPDVLRIARLGVVASMQPTHCTSDMKWVVARIGAERAQLAYAWRALAAAGATLAFGSDAPVEDIDPWPGLFAAETRQSAAFQPPQGFFPEQRLTRREAYRAFTTGAAYAAFTEKEQGSLEPGRYADFILLDKNPFEVSAAALRTMKVRATYLGGEQAWPKPVPDRKLGPPLARAPGKEPPTP